MNQTNGWSAYEKLVIARLNTIEKDLTTLTETVTLIRIEVAQLKIKAGVWGAIAGMVPALIASFVVFSGSF